MYDLEIVVVVAGVLLRCLGMGVKQGEDSAGLQI